jgi:hypothetical protein
VLLIYAFQPPLLRLTPRSTGTEEGGYRGWGELREGELEGRPCGLGKLAELAQVTWGALGSFDLGPESTPSSTGRGGSPLCVSAGLAGPPCVRRTATWYRVHKKEKRPYLTPTRNTQMRRCFSQNIYCS